MLPVSCLQLEVGNIAVALGGLQIWDILSSSPSHRADQPSVAGHNCVPVVSTRFSVSQQAVRFFFLLWLLLVSSCYFVGVNFVSGGRDGLKGTVPWFVLV